METAAVQYHRINIIAVDIPDEAGLRSLPLTVRPLSKSSVGNDGGQQRRYKRPYLETNAPATCLVYFTN